MYIYIYVRSLCIDCNKLRVELTYSHLTGGIEKVKAKAKETGLTEAQVAAKARKEKHDKASATKKKTGTYSAAGRDAASLAEYVMGATAWAKYLATSRADNGVWGGEGARGPMSDPDYRAATKKTKKAIIKMGLTDKRKRPISNLRGWTFTTDAEQFVDQDTQWSMSDNVEWTAPDGIAIFAETMAVAISRAYWATKTSRMEAAGRARKEGKQPM